MRTKQDTQGRFEFHKARLKITAEHHARYETIDGLLRRAPAILDLVHRELRKALKRENRKRRRKCTYTSENVLRILICKSIEGETYRGIVVRIDDSDFFRQFVKIFDGPMMDYTALNKLANCIRPKTWTRINQLLGEHAVEHGLITGESLRLDTTAVETNIHWPSDSGLLWDVYRVLARNIWRARKVDPEAVGDRRLQLKRAKKLLVRIHRRSRGGGATGRRLKRPYAALIRLVEAILVWSIDVADALEQGIASGRYGFSEHSAAVHLASELRHFAGLGPLVVDQTQRRVLRGEKVPNDEKIFSIFEPHTQLLKRGKAGKSIEFGHMILLEQVDGCFITSYSVFDEKPVEHELVEPSVQRHIELFGKPPSALTADKGFYESMAAIDQLEEQIDTVAIGKKGRRSEEEAARETDWLFKAAQRFRAGIEGTISFLKRCLRMLRCFNKGFEHYESTIGLTVFAHNLIVLARAPT